MATLLNPAQVLPLPPKLSTSAQILLVIGKGFTGSLTEDQPEPGQSLHFEDSPQVTPSWRAAAAQLPFALERPTSFPKEFEYVDFHSYEIQTDDGPKPALKVVCNNQAGDSWGIMETTFTDAPLVNEPSVEKDISGKNYRFYYAGDKLKYLAWQDGDVLYWISNSLQNSLDEDTMVQLAFSFKPI